jgi:hypothetical protein
MKWAEIVRLRTVNGQGLALRIKGLTEAFPDVPGLLETHVYVNADYEGDVSLSLLWETPSLPHQGSELGLRMNQAMRRIGLVDHTLWIETGTT